MLERETFVLADRLIAKVIDQITDEQWSMQLPEDVPTIGDRHYTLREVINYQAYDEAWVPAMMAGRRIEDVGADTFGQPLEGDLLADRPRERFAELSAKAIKAVNDVSEAELDTRTVHFSYGDFPAREALRHITSFRGMRAHDLASVLGQDVDMPDELVAGLWDMLEPRIDGYRAAGVFPPAVEVPDDAPLQDRLLGLTGRVPLVRDAQR